MKIIVLVKPNSKEEKIEKLADGSYKISVKEKPEEGKANEAVTRILADYFAVQKRSVRIITPKSRKKIIEIR